MTQDKKNTAIFTAFDDLEAENIQIPEKSLLRAVLQNAVSDMKREGELSRRARDFFLNNEDDYIFSFKAICSYLHIDPARVLVVVGLQGSKDTAEVKANSESIEKPSLAITDI